MSLARSKHRRFMAYRIAAAGGRQDAESAPAISYAGSPFTWTLGSAISTANVTNTGGSVTSYAVQAGVLPTGISLNSSTGALTGTPSDMMTSESVTIRATGPAGTSDAVIAITVTWLPSNISGLADSRHARTLSALWTTDARDVQVASDGDTVGGWDGVNGTSLQFLQDTAGERPLYKTNIQNGKAGILFDGTDDFLRLGSAALASVATYTISAVLRSAKDATLRAAYAIGDQDTGVTLFVDGSNNRDVNHNAVVLMVDGEVGTGTEMWVVRRTSAPLASIRVNGAAASLADNTSVPLAPNATSWIGTWRNTGAQPWKSYIFEVNVWPTAISDADAVLLETYYTFQYGTLT